LNFFQDWSGDDLSQFDGDMQGMKDVMDLIAFGGVAA
jgi:hypothetical protein